MHRLHFRIGRAVGLVAGVVEGGGDEVFEDLLFGRDHQTVINRHAQNAALGSGANGHETAAGATFHFHRIKLYLRLVHLFLDVFGSGLRGFQHLFHRLHLTGPSVAEIVGLRDFVLETIGINRSMSDWRGHGK